MSFFNNENMNSIYNYIFSESFNAYDNIIEKYPTFEKDIAKQYWALQSYDNFQEIPNNEKVAHAYTLIIMTHLLSAQ